MICKKCGHHDINADYIPKSATVNRRIHDAHESDFIELEQPFGTVPVGVRYIASKEHLAMHCRNCHYTWRVNVKD